MKFGYKDPEQTIKDELAKQQKMREVGLGNFIQKPIQGNFEGLNYPLRSGIPKDIASDLQVRQEAVRKNNFLPMLQSIASKTVTGLTEKLGQLEAYLTDPKNPIGFIGNTFDPRKIGDMAANQFIAGYKQFQSGEPSKIGSLTIPAKVAGVGKLATAPLMVTPGIVPSMVAMEGTKNLTEPIFGKDSLPSIGLSLLAGLATPGIGKLQKLQEITKSEKFVAEVPKLEKAVTQLETAIGRAPTKIQEAFRSLPVKERMAYLFGKFTKEDLQMSAPNLWAKIEGFEAEAVKQENSFNKIFAKWIGARQASKTEGLGEALKIKIPQEKAGEVIGVLEGTKKSSDPEVLSITKELRSRFDELYTQGKAAGLDTNYLPNYLSHYWKESEDVVKNLYSSVKGKPGFTKTRLIPTYEEGVQMGLTPKYTNPSAMLGEYVEKLQKTKADLSFVSELKQNNLIVKAGEKLPGMEPIVAPGFPVSKVVKDKQTIEGLYYAQPEIARAINKVFSEYNPQGAEKALDIGAKVAGAVQDVSLSGGLPKTPLNAWTLSQILFKELPAGRVKGPLKALWNSTTRADDYFQENLPLVQKLQQNNVPMNISLSLESLNEGNWLQKTFGSSIGEAWQKTMNQPTFQKFMPALQLEFFRDALTTASKKLPPVEAEQAAIQATKNFYGIVSSDKLALSGEVGKNLATLTLMAPRYRETVLNFLVNTIKGLKNPLAVENIANTKWLIGALATYGIYDYLNVQTTGMHMHENPQGLQDKILIPAGKYTIGVPYMSSILTLPRAGVRVGQELLQGDISGVVKEAGSSGLSTLLSPIADIAKNEDYFGREIVAENDSPQEKIKKTVNYLIGKYNHPYLRELFTKSGDPAYQKLSRALELPIRYYKTDSVKARSYYEARDEAIKGLNPTERAVYDKLHKPKTTDEDGLAISGYSWREQAANALDRLSNPNVLKAETQTALKTAQENNEVVNPFYALSPQQQEVVLVLKTLYPGSKEKSQIIQANSDWIQNYYKQRDQWTEYMKASGKFTDTLDSGAPKISPELRKTLDEYFSLPSGTGARSRYLMSHPEAIEYFEQNRNWTNAQRADLGLPLLEGFNSSGYKPKSKAVKSFGNAPAFKNFKVSTKKFNFSAPKMTPVTLRKSPTIKQKAYKFDIPDMKNFLSSK